MHNTHLQRAITERFDDMSPRVRQAARFVMQNPEEVALRSMRSVAAAAAVPPSTMLRLARHLSYDSYETFREAYREWMRSSRNPLSQRVLKLHAQGRRGSASGLIDQVVQRELGAISRTVAEIGPERLVKAQQLLSAARNIYVLGVRALYAPAFYFHYVCRTFTRKTVLLDGGGGTLLDDIRFIEPGDALLAFSISPYARDAVRAVEFARSQRVPVVAVTDSPVSPTARLARLSLLVSNSGESAALTSVLPALTIAQLLITLLITQSGDQGLASIAASSRQLAALDVYVRDSRQMDHSDQSLTSVRQMVHAAKNAGERVAMPKRGGSGRTRLTRD